MITYLLTNYPVFYFILSTCFIITGTAVLVAACLRTQYKPTHTRVYDIIETELFQFFVMQMYFEEANKTLLICNRYLCLNYDYSQLFDTPKLNHLKTLKKTYHKNQETIIIVTTKLTEDPVKEVPEYKDVGDIIRMKMNLLSCA